MKTIAQGASTQTYVATHPSLSGVSGKYFSNCNEKYSSRYGRDADLASALWEKTQEIVEGLD
jgi:WW domain-containing oxidoreductase